jgi:hypothetical protein
MLLIGGLFASSGYVFAGAPEHQFGTPHQPAYVNGINDLVVVKAEPKKLLIHSSVPITSDVNIVDLIQQLDEPLIHGYLENLTAFGPRETGTESCDLAAHYLYDTFAAMGLAVAYKNYTDNTVSGSNIEATLYGNDTTNIFIICGHYDCVAAGVGADDDGSGVAAVLAAAKLMSQYTFSHTVRFVAFSGEEQGLIGSRHYAEDAYNHNESIVAVLNADMIGYATTSSDGHLGKIFENPASEWIVTYTQGISQLYSDYIDIELMPQGETWGSDHYYFWEYGYDAVFYHEFHFNDYYHSANDTIGHMNLTYDVHFSRLILATLATMAQQPRPVFEISDITGGLGARCNITNVGDAVALNVSATIQINGGVFKRINITGTEGFLSLEVLQTLGLKAMPFGLGKITITITAEASNAGTVTKQVTAFAFGPLVLKVTNLP